MPGAELGYISGSGTIYDLTASPASGTLVHERIAIMAAVHGNVSVTRLCASPLAPDNGPHPNPSQLNPAVERTADDIGNTVTWPGMAPP